MGEMSTVLADGCRVGDQCIRLQRYFVTSHTGAERDVVTCRCLCAFVCLRAKWVFGSRFLIAERETPTHVKLHKDSTGTIYVLIFLCVYV